MNKSEKRIAIAKDVIKLIKAKKITVQTEHYFIARTKSSYIGKQLKEVLPKIKTCQVCALGGLFYSYVMKYNNYEIAGSGIGSVNVRDGNMRRLLEDIFTLKQLTLIECAFEKADINHQCSLVDCTITIMIKAIHYRGKNNLKTDKDALIHIMQNIIKNKGTFKP